MSTFLIFFVLFGGGGFVYQIFENLHVQSMKKLELRERQLAIEEKKAETMARLGPQYAKIQDKVYERLINSDLDEYIPESRIEKQIIKDLDKN
jgi:hypothetical protein